MTLKCIRTMEEGRENAAKEDDKIPKKEERELEGYGSIMRNLMESGFELVVGVRVTVGQQTRGMVYPDRRHEVPDPRDIKKVIS